MKILPKLLTAFHSFWGGICLVMVILGNVPIYTLLIGVGYICAGMALNYKGGKVVRYLGFLMSAILSLFLIGTTFSLFAPLLGHPFEPLLLFSTLLLGLGGLATIICLKNMTTKAEQLNT